MKTPILVIAVLAFVGIVAAVYAITRDDGTQAIGEPTSFEECAALYPVMESYPRQCKTPSGLSFTEEIAAPTPEAPAPVGIEGLIEVESLSVGEVVASPLIVEGRARGYWFFEATFGLEVRNAVGTVIAQHYAEALDEWMTEEYVPFRGEITFPTQPSGTQGSVVFKRANASGDPERDQELVIPVTF